MFDKRKQLPQLLSSLHQFSICDDTFATCQTKASVEYRIGMPKQGDQVHTARTVDTGKPIFDRPFFGAGPPHHDLYCLMRIADPLCLQWKSGPGDEAVGFRHSKTDLG